MGRGEYEAGDFQSSLRFSVLEIDRSKEDLEDFYHVAPQAVRRTIAADSGLWAGISPELSEEGVYVFDNLQAARSFQKQHLELGPTDIWQMTLSDNDIQGLIADPLEDGGWRHENLFLEPQGLEVLPTE